MDGKMNEECNEVANATINNQSGMQPQPCAGGVPETG
jgi:hypothetical protein